MAAILDWMGTVGINTSSEGVKLEAEEMLQLLDAAMKGSQLLHWNTSQFRGGPASCTVQRERRHGSAVLLGSLLLWLVIWWLGLRRISRGRTGGAKPT